MVLEEVVDVGGEAKRRAPASPRPEGMWAKTAVAGSASLSRRLSWVDLPALSSPSKTTTAPDRRETCGVASLPRRAGSAGRWLFIGCHLSGLTETRAALSRRLPKSARRGGEGQRAVAQVNMDCAATVVLKLAEDAVAREDGVLPVGC